MRQQGFAKGGYRNTTQPSEFTSGWTFFTTKTQIFWSRQKKNIMTNIKHKNNQKPLWMRNTDWKRYSSISNAGNPTLNLCPSNQSNLKRRSSDSETWSVSQDYECFQQQCIVYYTHTSSCNDLRARIWSALPENLDQRPKLQETDVDWSRYTPFTVLLNSVEELIFSLNILWTIAGTLKSSQCSGQCGFSVDKLQFGQKRFAIRTNKFCNLDHGGFSRCRVCQPVELWRAPVTSLHQQEPTIVLLIPHPAHCFQSFNWLNCPTEHFWRWY